MKHVHVYGDSHATYFFPKFFGYVRMGMDPREIKFEGQAIPAASVAGFRPGQSTLDTKTIISENAKKARYLVLAFGQVDLELGYYYRKVIKKEDTNPQKYVAWLSDIYETFVGTLELSEHVALKGVNLTVLSHLEFSHQYVSRIITERTDKSEAENAQAIKELKGEILSEQDQNAMHLEFNRNVSRIAEKNGIAYFDINDHICRTDPVSGIRGPQMGLAPEYLPATFDHHIADSIKIRAIHIRCALRALGLETLLS